MLTLPPYPCEGPGGVQNYFTSVVHPVYWASCLLRGDTSTYVNRHAQGRAAVHKDTRSYTSLCTYRHAHTHSYTHVCHKHADMRIHKCTRAYIRLHTGTRIHKCTDTQACPQVLAGMPTQRVHTHTQTCLYTEHTHIETHLPGETHTYTSAQPHSGTHALFQSFKQ